MSQTSRRTADAYHLNHSIMVFPNGPRCNLNCEYCYYLDKVKNYPEEKSFQMDCELLEEYIKQYIEIQSGPIINFGWQGGEPTIRGLEFFQKAVELQKKYLPSGWHIQNSFQTNGIFLDDNWCSFFKKNNFLVGISLDGTKELHDLCRKDKHNRPTYDKVVSGIRLLQKHKVEYNVLCTVNNLNSRFPLDVYISIKELGGDFIQFIPIVNYDNLGNTDELSVNPADYGNFLVAIFDEWINKDYGQVFVQIFEDAVRAWAGFPPALCTFSKTCGNAEVVEFNGDVYSCDHFVFPEYKLGNIKEKSLVEMANSNQQIQFGLNKFETLPRKCLECAVRFICNGGCPKNRTIRTSDGKKGLNYLCGAYQQFFNYIAPYMNTIVFGLKRRMTPSHIKERLVWVQREIWDVGRNDPCPCGSGKKYKKCCIDRIESTISL